MLATDISECIRQLIASPLPPRIYIAATGAGASIQHEIWKVPGASSLLVGAIFPYDAAMTADLLGYKPEQYVSEETAVALAHAAYFHALMADRTGPAIGVGVTASVTSNREHRGEHRAHIVIMDAERIGSAKLTLPKVPSTDYDIGFNAREADEEAVTDATLRLLLASCRPWTSHSSDIVVPMVRCVRGSLSTTGADDVSQKVFFEHPVFEPNGNRLKALGIESGQMLLMPSACNPPHFGHLGMLREAEQLSQRKGIFQITANAPHKPALSVAEMLQRARWVRQTGYTLLFDEGDPLYIDKARKRPGAHFVIGIDAFVRMLDPKWCPVPAMLEEFLELGTRFYVAGRDVQVTPRDTAFCGLMDLTAWNDLLPYQRQLFTGLRGKWDISSTELRKQKEEHDWALHMADVEEKAGGFQGAGRPRKKS